MPKVSELQPPCDHGYVNGAALTVEGEDWFVDADALIGAELGTVFFVRVERSYVGLEIDVSAVYEGWTPGPKRDGVEYLPVCSVLGREPTPAGA